MKPVQRLNRLTIEVLEKYHSDADTAINVMETTIKGLQHQLETCQSVTKVLQDAQKDVTKPLQQTWAIDGIQGSLNFDSSYWKKLSETVDSCIEKAKRY